MKSPALSPARRAGPHAPNRPPPQGLLHACEDVISRRREMVTDWVVEVRADEAGWVKGRASRTTESELVDRMEEGRHEPCRRPLTALARGGGTHLPGSASADLPSRGEMGEGRRLRWPELHPYWPYARQAAREIVAAFFPQGEPAEADSPWVRWLLCVAGGCVLVDAARLAACTQPGQILANAVGVCCWVRP